MKELKKALLSTVLHTLELVVVFAAVYFAVRLFSLPFDSTFSALVVAAVVKFARSYEKIPVFDYVNRE